MTRTEPEIADNARLTKTDACRLLGVCPRTLDRYARHFGISPKINAVTMRPIFYGRDIKRLWRCID